MTHAETRGPAEASRRAGLVAFLRRHPGVWVPALYLFASTVGTLDAWSYFRAFGINVFLYSDVADFLLASLREPGGWVIVALSAAIAAMDQWGSRRAARSTSIPRWLRWVGSPRYRQASWAAGLALFVAYIVLLGGVRADAVLDGSRGREVRVVLADDAATSKTAVALGSTVRFLFLYDRTNRIVSIHPYENVLSIDSAVPP
jgi:hypothetical protein